MIRADRRRFVDGAPGSEQAGAGQPGAERGVDGAGCGTGTGVGVGVTVPEGVGVGSIVPGAVRLSFTAVSVARDCGSAKVIVPLGSVETCDVEPVVPW